MVVPRTSTRLATGLWNSSIGYVRATTRTRSWQRIQRRHYPASEGHGSHKSSSDVPWAIGAALVTIPSVGYLIQPQLNKSSSHGHDDGGHGEHGDQDGHGATGENEEKSEEDQESEAKKPDGAEDASDGDSTGGSGSEDSSEEQSANSGPDDAGQGSPETSGKEAREAGSYEVDSGSNVEGVQFKGATSGGTRDGEQGDTRKHIPDAKGFAKKRIESDYGKEQGQLEGEDSGGSDKAAPSKPPSGSNTTSQKQEGLSNTNTKHSTDMDNNPDKSKKGEGVVETAKVKGSVDPSRPTAENRPGKEDATGSQSDS
ncbi:MAG: hypothetical protein Q9168_005380 [Polycauliona sp. 1 TL-2023]